jgi:hypothetical protein
MYTIHQMTNSQVTFMKVGAADSLPEAIAFARNYHGLRKADVTVTVEVENTAVPIVSFSTRRIMGDFQKQMWGGRKGDDALKCGKEQFDATLHILSMPYKDVVKIRDNHETSDAIGRAHVAWDGPHEVELLDSMCDFFGVAKLAELTEDHFNFVVEQRQDEIRRSMRVIEVQAQAPQVAERISSPAEAARELLISLSKLPMPGETDPNGNVFAPTEGAAQAQLAALISQSRAIIAKAEALARQDALAHGTSENDRQAQAPRR